MNESDLERDLAFLYEGERIILLNSPVVTGWGVYSWLPISITTAQRLIRDAKEVISAVGHEATAKIMTELLDFPVQVNRVRVTMPEDGDMAIVFRLLDRIPEGKVLSEEELRKIPYELGLLIYTRCPFVCLE